MTAIKNRISLWDIDGITRALLDQGNPIRAAAYWLTGHPGAGSIKWATGEMTRLATSIEESEQEGGM